MSTTDAQAPADTPACTGAGLDPAPTGPGPTGAGAAESAGELLARLGTDAQAWASEFVRSFAGETVGDGEKVDVGLMLGWFASAIETGRAAGYSARPVAVGALFGHEEVAARVGEVPVPLYAYLDGRDPINIGTLTVPMNAVTGDDPFTITISPDMVDRSQWVARSDFDGACRTIAEMHAAAVGEVTGPRRGVVEDVADVRARMLAAEEALAAADGG